MNDFTKEELEELMNGLDWIIDRGQQAEITFMTRIKIQSMIENYCEHESAGTYYEQFRWKLCRKCGVQYK